MFSRAREGSERMVRAEFPRGRKIFYEGEKGSERVVRAELHDGQKRFFEGSYSVRGVRKLIVLCVS